MIPKRQILLAFCMSIVTAGYAGLEPFLRGSQIGLIFAVAVGNSARVVGITFHIAKYCIPLKKGTIVHHFAYFVFFLLHAMVGIWHRGYGGPFGNGVVSSCLFLWLCFFYRKNNGNIEDIPTLASYLVVPIFILTATGIIISELHKQASNILIQLGLAYTLGIFCFLLFFDKPCDPEKREGFTPSQINNNSAYCILYLWGLMYTGVGMSMVLNMFNGSVLQTLAIQCLSVLLLFASQKVGIRASNRRRFAPLMTIIYYSVDLFQIILFIEVEAFSLNFFYMLFIQEAGSMMKNAGLIELFAWVLQIRHDNPYKSVECVDMLRIKGLVDTLSEVLVAFGAFTIYLVEKEARGMEGSLKYNVTHTLMNGTAFSYEAEFCSVTCVGWIVNGSFPPPPPKATASLLLLFMFVAFLRSICLGLETYFLRSLQRAIDPLESAPRVSDIWKMALSDKNRSEPEPEHEPEHEPEGREATNKTEKNWGEPEPEHEPEQEPEDREATNNFSKTRKTMDKIYPLEVRKTHLEMGAALSKGAAEATRTAAAIFSNVRVGMVFFAFLTATMSVQNGLYRLAYSFKMEGVEAEIIKDY